MDFNFYVDESGDEGIDRGTQWFLIGGFLVRKKDDLEVSRAVDRVKSAIGQRDVRKALHWNELVRMHPKRLLIIKEFGELPIDLIICAMHKPSLVEKAVFRRKQWLYNYVTRHVVERLSWLVRDRTQGKGHVDLIFESRAHTSYADMKEYIDRLKAEPGSQIYGEVLGDPVPRTKQERKNLQIADALVGTCFSALEPNRYGMTDQSYMPYMQNLFYRRNGKLLSYGLKILPHDCPELLDANGWLKKI